MELLDVLDENGNKTGRIETREKVHEEGLWHIHVGVWIMNKEGNLLFQKRSIEKKVNPNKWTRTGGHVSAGETPIMGIQREVEEEIGVKIPKEDFKLLEITKSEKKLPNTNKITRNFIYSYFALVDYKIEDYVMQKEEVSDLKYITIEELEEAIKNNDDKYTLVKWKNTDKLIKDLKELRKKYT